MQAKHYAVWTVWILGVALIFLSNARLIDAQIGWGGFWIALAASLISRLPLWKTRQPESQQYSPDEIRQFVADYTRRLDAGEAPRWELLRDRAVWWQWLEAWDESITDLNEAIPLNASIAGQARLLRGNAFYKLKRYVEAVEDLTFGVDQLRDQPDQSADLLDYRYVRACAWLCIEEFGKVVADIDEIEATGQIQEVHLIARGQALAHQLEFRRALEDFRKATKLDSQCVAAWNGVAYVLATAPDDKIRNGAEALRCAQRACELSHWSAWYPLTTLAGAWAECGEFDKAIEYAERALELAPDSEKAERRERVEQYRRGQPYRHNRQSRLHEAGM